MQFRKQFKYFLAAILALIIVLPAQAGLKVALGIQGGAGGTLIKDKISNIASGNETINSHGWSANAKGELVFSLGKLRLGYQFMYSYSTAPSATTSLSTANTKSLTITAQSSSLSSNMFGNYFLLELAIIDKPKFALVPGTMIGGYTGFQSEQNPNNKVKLPTLANHRFSIGAELNIEFKTKAASFTMGPNYYFYKMQGKVNSENKENQHFIGVSIGTRINLKKSSTKKK